MVGALLVATIGVTPIVSGCGVIVMCPSNTAYKRQLDREFYAKAGKCENGDDKVCETISEDAKKKVQMCKDCSGCSGEETYVEVAEIAKEKNLCNHKKDATACFALAVREGAAADAKNEYSSLEVALYQKSCEYGDQLGCKMAASRGQDMSAGMAKNFEARQCGEGCKLLYGPCMRECGSQSRQCLGKCSNDVGVCMSSCH